MVLVLIVPTAVFSDEHETELTANCQPSHQLSALGVFGSPWFELSVPDVEVLPLPTKPHKMQENPN